MATKNKKQNNSSSGRSQKGMINVTGEGYMGNLNFNQQPQYGSQGKDIFDFMKTSVNQGAGGNAGYFPLSYLGGNYADPGLQGGSQGLSPYIANANNGGYGVMPTGGQTADKNRMFGLRNADGTLNFGNIADGVGALSGLYGAWNGMQQLGLAKDAFNLNKGITLDNHANQMALTQSELDQRQKRRDLDNAASGFSENLGATPQLQNSFGGGG